MGGIFGGGGSAPTPPPIVIPEPTPIPLPDEEAIKLAERREIARRMAGSGRASTILTEDDQTLG